MKINLEQLSVRPVNKAEEPRYRELMQQYHYLGNLGGCPRIEQSTAEQLFGSYFPIIFVK